MYKAAKNFRKRFSNTHDLALATGRYLVEHAQKLPKQYEPKSILESRFTPPAEAFRRGMLSCGAIANIAAEMLRFVGIKVKLIHGESAESVDHAWISAYCPENKKWVEYDLTRENGKVPLTHKKKIECNNWQEIRKQILKDHETYEARIKAQKFKRGRKAPPKAGGRRLVGSARGG